MIHKGPDGEKGPAAVEPTFFEQVAEVQAIVDEANEQVEPGPFEAVTYEPHWLRITVPDYPHVAHLLLWPDGKVTWK